MDSPRVRVLLCDDHAIVRQGLQQLLDGMDDLEVVASTADGAEAVEAAARLRPDVALMDLAMPVVDGVAATRRIAEAAPDTRVVILTSFADRERVLEAIDAGAVGYLLKDADAPEVVRAIRAAARGQAPLHPRVARAVMAGATTPAPDPLRSMSPREREVLELVGAGLSNRAIGIRLGITEATVRAHLTRIYRRIGVADRTQAALWLSRRAAAPA
jgi:DNA-binding NarL/FixJ family response regulator